MEAHQIKDAQPQLGANHYRVKQVYQDGSFDYTKIQRVDFKLDLAAISVFPNPVQEKLMVNLSPYQGKQGHLNLVNQYGQTVKSLNLEKINTDLIELNTAQIDNGLYYLNIQIDQQQPITKKVWVLRNY